VPVQRELPYTNYNFLVDAGLGAEAGFSEVELPEGELEVIEYREGADRRSSARKLPGLARYPNVTLKRGVAGRLELYEWWNATRNGAVDRRNVVITLLDEQRNPVQRWTLRDAWPVKLSFGPLSGRGHEVLVEALELAHEGFETE
jgi:phage tail-like protein